MYKSGWYVKWNFFRCFQPLFVTLGFVLNESFFVVGYEWAVVTAPLSYILIPLSLTSELFCIATLNFSAAGLVERVKSNEAWCVWLTAEWNRMQRLHCQPAGVSANRWGNAGVGTPKLGLPWKRFASWSPAIRLQLFSFHDRSTRA